MRRKKKIHIAIPQSLLNMGDNNILTLCKPNVGVSNRDTVYTSLHHSFPISGPYCNSCIRYANEIDKADWEHTWNSFCDVPR